MSADLSQEELLFTVKKLEEENRDLIHKTKTLSEDLDRYRLLVDNASDLIHSVTPRGKFLYTNQAWRDTLGYTDDEIRRLSLMEIVEQNCKGKCENIFMRLINGEKIDRNTTCFLTRDGDRVIVEGRCTTHFEDGKPLCMTGIFRNLTEQTRSELALLESEKKYNDLFENSSDLIQIVNPNGQLLYVNHAWRKTFGYNEDEIADLSIFDLIATDCQDHCKATFQQIISSPKLHCFKTVFMAKDGSKIFIEGNGTCTFENGKPIVTQCIFQDVTEKKKLEEELIKVQKLESLGVLAGGIAHDFNNLLTAILGNISMAKMTANPREIISEYLDKTEKATIRAQKLTKQLLTFSRGGTPIKKFTTLPELIQESTSFVLRGSKSRCSYHFAEDLWAVEADEGQLGQVAQNLIINAHEAMPDGGTITIKAANRIIGPNEIIPLTPGKYVELIVKDQGTGIPSEHLFRIFDPYFSSKSTGSGLGLAISYSIIKNHGGLITVNSKPDHGAVFTILLPATMKTAPKTQHRDTLQKINGKRKLKILLMDDNNIVQDVTTSMLTLLGCDVIQAWHGEEALGLYQEAHRNGDHIDMVIMDLTIPGGMGGKEAISALRSFDPKAKAVVASGYADDPIMANYEEYGFVGVLTKPFKVEDLNNIIAAILHQ